MPPLPSKPAAPKILSSLARLRQLGERKPQLRFGFLAPLPAADTLRLVLPFRRSWLLIAIVGIFLLIFSLPLVSIARQSGPPSDDLFALVFTLFHLFWALGWSVGVGGLALIFLALLLGREVVVVRSGAILIRLELLGLGVGGEYEARGIGNLRSALPDAAAGTGWRGPHLAFDYYGIPVAFGSDLREPRAAEILQLVRRQLADLLTADFPLDEAPVFTEAAVADSPRLGAEAPPDSPPVAAGPGIIANPGWTVRLASPSTQALLLANLVPLAGVYFLGWEIGEIMLLYWAESGIIGFFNLLKLAVVGRWATLFYGPFFVGHYGAFMAAHLLFIYGFFVKGPAAMGNIAAVEVLDKFISLWPGLLALGISHLISFLVNFIGHREFVGASVQKQMAEPYSRIMIMHLTIILGGFVTMALGTSFPALLLLILAKIGADLRAHARQRS